MSVGFKSPLSSANTNAAFVSKTVDSTSVAQLTLNKPSEGTQVTSVQKAINKAFEGVGTTGESDATINDYSSNNYILDGDNRKQAIQKLDTQLKTTQDALDVAEADIAVHEIRLDTIQTLASTFGGNKTFTDNVTVDGNFTVNGTTTTINSTTVDSVDPNITVNKTGNDATSEGSGLTVDRTGTKGSLVYENALASRFKIGDLGSERQVADVSSVQAFTNKDIDGGTASNTSRLTIPKAATGTLTALTRKQGTVVYDTTLNKPYYDDGSALQPFGTGSGSGAVNFIVGGDAESGTTGYAVDSFTAAARPSGALTGVGTGVTFTTSATAPLAGTNSFLFAKDAVNRQGRVVYTGVTITPAYFAKVLQISADYIVSSGTFVAGTSTTDSDVIFYLWDVTNSTFIEPSSFKLLSNSTTISDKFNATFQTSATGTSYRLLMYVASTSAAAYTLKLDNISVSPSTYVYGTPVTDVPAFTPTGSFTTNTTYSTVGYRIGRFYFFELRLAFSGAPNAASCTVNFLPNLAIDTQYLTSIATDGTVPIGEGRTRAAGQVFDASAYYNGTQNLAIVVKNATGTYTGAATNVTNLIPATYGSGDSIIITGKVPILGWASSVQTSDQTDTRVVAARVGRASNQTGIALNNSSFKLAIDTVVDGDTHGMFELANNRLIARVPGWYDIVGQGYFTGTNVLNNLYYLSIWKNGVENSIGVASYPPVGAAFGLVVPTKIYLNMGDYVELYVFGQGNNSVNTLTAAVMRLAASRVSGPSAIAATESVSLRYTNTAGTSIAAGTGTAPVSFPTRDYDSHNAWSGTIFTAPIAGKYRLNCAVVYASATWVLASKQISVRKNSTDYSIITLTVPAVAYTGQLGLSGMDDFNLLAGETLDIRLQHNEATARSLIVDTTTNHISIQRIGN